MKKIDNYVENIYKDFEGDNEEVEILKEEMKSHLYDKVSDLIKDGYTEDQSIDMAINNFGDKNSFTKDMSTIISKQNMYTNILFKISIIIFILGVVFKAGGAYSEKVYSDNWHKNRGKIVGDITGEISSLLAVKTDISNEDKSRISKILDDYNDRYENGLYYIRILKNGISQYEYNRTVDDSLKRNNSSGGTTISNGWLIEHKQTDLDSLRNSAIWDRFSDIPHISNTIHFKLKNLGFWLIMLSWVLVAMYYTQKAILNYTLSRSKVILLSLETMIILAVYTSDKDIIVPTVAIFLLLNAIYPKIRINLERRI